MKPPKATVQFANPLDDLFDIDGSDRGSVTDYEQVTEGELASLAAPPEPQEKEADDIETDGRFDEVYDQAIGTFKNQMAYTEIIEPRYAARNAEVASTFLNLALQAASAKARVKNDRKRVGQFIPGIANKVTNNTVICTREQIMKMMIDNDTSS